MSSIPAEAFRLKNISPKSYEHPADRAATAALKSIPYIDPVVKKLTSLGYERTLRSESLGKALLLGEDQLPRIWSLHHQAYDVLDVQPLPELYVTQFPLANAFTMGMDRPVVVVSSELVALLDDDGMRAVLGHEAGHVLSDHTMYRTALLILLAFGNRLPMIGIPLGAVRMALTEWYRASELSCDRAAALVTRDPEAVCRTLMAISAGIPADQLNLAAFIRQAEEFSTTNGSLEWLSRRSLQMKGSHPLTVRRTAELLDWVRSGEYDRIVGGEYIRRGEEPPARDHAGVAADHYAERFKEIFAEATEQIEKAGKQIREWLNTGGDWVRSQAASKPAESAKPAEPEPEPDPAPVED